MLTARSKEEMMLTNLKRSFKDQLVLNVRKMMHVALVRKIRF